MRINDFGELIGDGEIGEGVGVEHVVKILVIVAAKAIVVAVVLIEYRSDCIKSVAVSVILLKPESNVRQQKPLHLEFRIVEYLAVPQRMISLLTAMKILVVSPVPKVDPFIGVFGSM